MTQMYASGRTCQFRVQCRFASMTQICNLMCCCDDRPSIWADCVRAEPVIYDQVNGADRPVTMVRVFVGDKPTWKTREHPLRTDKRFRITGIPTLIRWENGAQASRLEASEAADETKIKRLMRTRSSRSSSMSSGGSRSASSSPRASKSKSSSFTSKRTSWRVCMQSYATWTCMQIK